MTTDALTPPPFAKTGGHPAPAPDPKLYPFAQSGIGGAAAVSATLVHTIPPYKRMPVGLQRYEDCGGWQLGAACYNALANAGGSPLMLSPRWLYYESRKLQGWLPGDLGTIASTNMKVVNTLGNAELAVWPYEGDINQVPSDAAVLNAATHKFNYYACQTLADIQTAITADHAVCMQWAATTEWWYPTRLPDGSCEILTPALGSNNFIGGHFTTAVGIDMTRKMQDGTTGGMLVENSWGDGWGDNGTAWVSISAWVNQRGDIYSRYVVTATAVTPAPLPPTPTPSVKVPTMNILTLPTAPPTALLLSSAVLSGCQIEWQGEQDIGYLNKNAGGSAMYPWAPTQAGNYLLTIPLAAVGDAASFNLVVDGVSLGTVPVPNTGGWGVQQAIQIVVKDVTAGKHTIGTVHNAGDEYNEFEPYIALML